MVNRNEKSVIRLETVQVFFSYYEISTVNKIVEMLQNSRFMSHAWLEWTQWENYDQRTYRKYEKK